MGNTSERPLSLARWRVEGCLCGGLALRFVLEDADIGDRVRWKCASCERVIEVERSVFAREHAKV